VESGFERGTLFEDEMALGLIPHGLSALVIIDELERAAELVEILGGAARERGSIYGFLIARAHWAEIRTRRGDLLAAEADLRTTVDGFQEHGRLYGLISAVWWAADALIERPALADVAHLAISLELPPDLLATRANDFNSGSGGCEVSHPIVGVDGIEAAVQRPTNTLDFYYAYDGGSFGEHTIGGAGSTYGNPSLVRFSTSQGTGVNLAVQGAYNTLDFYYAYDGGSFGEHTIGGAGSTYGSPSLVRLSGITL
jgi:hypothetical protein